MEFSPQQAQALERVHDWLTSSDQQVFRLFGYAGTGKTTLAKDFASGVGGHVMFGAFTGKAAFVLRQKGCPASTIHQMIYITKEKSKKKLFDLQLKLSELRDNLIKGGMNPDQVDGQREYKDLAVEVQEEKNKAHRPLFELNLDSSVRDASLVVIDECSMVNQQMGEDLLSFGTKVLVLGDPAQLPPVAGAGYFTSQEPDIMLTEIHRQARENPIIAMATDVRNRKNLSLGNYGSSQVVSRVDAEETLGFDQILVGRNKTRYASNRRSRELRGFQAGNPLPGDKLVCLRNNHDLGLLNGALWKAREVMEIDSDRVSLEVEPELGGEALSVVSHTHYFQGREDQLQWWMKKEAEEFDYGYAMTVHKAQGSQWGSVLLFDEGDCFRQDKWKWLYTGITRAADRVKIVRK